MIKIKSWKKLDREELNKGYFVDTGSNGCFIIQHKTLPAITLNYCIFTKEEIISILKVFGLEVQFEQPRTFTDQEKAIKTVFEKGWIARDECGNLYLYSDKPTINYGNWGNGDEYYKLPDTLFSWLNFDDDPMSLEEIE